jgi:hypothetical protein
VVKFLWGPLTPFFFGGGGELGSCVRRHGGVSDPPWCAPVLSKVSLSMRIVLAVAQPVSCTHALCTSSIVSNGGIDESSDYTLLRHVTVYMPTNERPPCSTNHRGYLINFEDLF